MEIQSETLKIAHDKLDNGCFGFEDIAELENISADDFVELIDLTNKYNRFSYLLRAYLTVYNSKTVENAESIISKNTIDTTISKSWNEEACPEDLNMVFLSFKLFQTDLAERIRNGYIEQENEPSLIKFDKQIINFILSLGKNMKNKNFYSTITNNSLSEEDNRINLATNKEIQHFKELYKLIEYANKIIDYKHKKDNSDISKSSFNKVLEYHRNNILNIDKNILKKLTFLPEEYIGDFYKKPSSINDIESNTQKEEYQEEEPKEQNEKEEFTEYDSYQIKDTNNLLYNKPISKFIHKLTIMLSENKNNKEEDIDLLITDSNNHMFTRSNGFLIGGAILIVITIGLGLLFFTSPNNSSNENVEKVLTEGQTKNINNINMPNDVKTEINYVK